MKRIRLLTAVLTALTLLLAVCVPALAAEAFNASFVVTGGEAVVTVYDTQDYTAGYTSDTAVARNSDTGEIDVSGGGQINFTVTPADGLTIAGIDVDGTFKNLKGPEDTGRENTYRITKIESDLTVTVTLQAGGPAETPDTPEQPGETTIVFTDEAVTITGDGAAADGTVVEITGAGTYVLSGACTGGSVSVKKNVTGVTLKLDGLTLTSHATAAIVCGKGSEVVIEAAEGSVNALADDKYNNDDIYTDSKTYPDIENAVIKAKDGSSLTICGTGTIGVTAVGKNAVKAADLTIRDVTLDVRSSDDGVKADNTLTILSGKVTIHAADDGIKCEDALVIGAEGANGPVIDVTKASEGIEAATVTVYSGNVRVNATDDGINAANGDIADRSEAFCYNQYGGYVYVNVSNGDGIDSNGSATLAGGTLEVWSPSQGDGDPIDTEFGCAFEGATVLAVGHAMMQQRYTGAYVAFGGASSGGRPGFGGAGGAQTSIVKVGDRISITDADGNTVYAAQTKAVRDASYVVFASPDLVSGAGYTLNGTVTAAATAGSATDPGRPPEGDPGQPPEGDPGQPPEGDPGQPPEGDPGQPPEGDPGRPPEGDPGQQPPDDRPEPVRGDADMDGKVTARDARLVLRASAKLETLEGPAMMNCDLDGDGKLTAKEARLILRFSAKLEKSI